MRRIGCKGLRAVSLLGVLCLLTTLGGCAGSQQDGKAATGEVALVVGQREMGHINPNYDMDLISYYVAANMLNKLVAVSATFAIIPDLADRWGVSGDGLKWTFYLNKDARWHDGTPATSADVKWSIESVIAEKGVAAARLGDINQITTPDQHTVEIHLKQPNAVLLNALGGYYGVFILPKHLYEGTDVRKNEYNWKPVGTGPFVFETWERGSHLTLSANPDYFRGRPEIDKLIFKFADHIPVVVAALEAGEMHTTQLTVTFGDIPRLQEDPNMVVTMQPYVNPVWLGFNLSRPPFNDLRVRQAIAHAIDRDAISDIVYKGLAPAEHTAWCSSIAWANNPAALQPAFDPSRAEQLLDEAGLPKGPDGIRLTTSISTFRGTGLWGMPETAELVTEQLRQVGIRAIIHLMDFATWTEKVNRRFEFDMAIAGGLRGPDPSDFATFVGKGGARNCMGYLNARVEELFAAGLRESDMATRAGIYHEIHEIVAHDLPLLNLILNVNPRVHRREFAGFEWDPEWADKARDHDFTWVYRVSE